MGVFCHFRLCGVLESKSIIRHSGLDPESIVTGISVSDGAKFSMGRDRSKRSYCISTIPGGHSGS